ncbi:Intraflagellar transport protein che-13 [Aphelenchoides fujianensis]|nr:Intraflagellar transport protein che-13 [Aphelenchoides fujianensis]
MGENAGPGAAFEVHALSEQLVEKLKLLDYEKELVGKMDGMKIVPRQVLTPRSSNSHYFASATNAGEQFFVFTTLCTWLMRKAQWKDVNLPSEMDDPNTTVGLILEAMRAKELDANYATQKLKSGAGKPCISLLLALVKEAIKANKFEFQRIVPVETEQPNDEQDQQADEAELTADQFDEEDAAAGEDEDDVVVAEIHDAQHVELQDDLFQEPLQAIMHTTVEPNSLKNEIDRILPQLRVTIRASDKHWKLHEEQLAKLQETARSQFDAVQPFLQQMNSEIGSSIERIQSREKHLERAARRPPAGVPAGAQRTRRIPREIQVSGKKEWPVDHSFREASGGLETRQETLQRVSDEIVQIKQQIDEQGAQNSNGAPIAKITQAIAKLEQSILTMSIQTAAIEQSLHQTQLNDRAASAYYQAIS